MNYLLMLILSILLIGCTTNDAKLKLSPKKLSKTDKEYIFKGIDKCSNLYTDGKFSILEVSCISNSQNEEGLYIFDGDSIQKFKWYDERFNRWAMLEGCDEEYCSYEITTHNNRIVEFKYNYSVNLSYGFYKIKVIDKELKIVEHQNANDPS